MSRRTLGYVELEWVCPACKNRNPGSQKICKTCGAAQPENVQFEAPLQQTLVKEAEKIAQAQAGPDRHCPYCDARNPATAKICSQCGGDLSKAPVRSAGEIVGAFQSTPAPPVLCPACGSANVLSSTICKNCGAALDKPRAVAAISARHHQGSILGLLFAVFGIILLVVFVIVFFALRTTTLTGTVQSADWVRTVSVQALVPVQEQSWRDDVPASVAIDGCSRQYRGTSDTPTADSQEVCGTPYTIDKGSGYGEVVQDCWYEVYDDMCTYTVQRWRTVDTLTTRGTGLTPLWPTLNLSIDQRASDRNEQYRCTIIANDERYTYTTGSFEDYLTCQPGAQVQLDVNSFGSVMSLEGLQ
jgi:predicted amidophosphoribosyltransferase